jgi:ATP-binding cassette subfamily B (MDR/TAP) protein 1
LSYQFQFATGFEKFLMCIGIFCGIGSGLSIPANIYIFGNLVGSMVNAQMDNIMNPQNVNATIDSNVTADFLMNAVTEFAVGNTIIGAVLLIFTYFGVMIFNYTALKQTFRIRTMYLRSVLHQDISWYDLTKSGEVASRLTE